MKDLNIKRHALILLLLMAGLYFFSYFQRVAIPGTIFNEIQKDFTASASAVTALSSIYLLIYASLQLVIGMLTDRYGGVKIILLCGLCLCAGSVLFPLSKSLWMLYLSRALVGVGASGMYLCIIKETDELFSSRNFVSLVGLFCMIGYSGGLFGTKPFRGMVDAMGWRPALLLVAVITAVFLVLTYLIGRSFMGKTRIIAGQPVRAKLLRVLKNTLAYPLIIATTINFTLYFSIQAMIGPKFIEDFLKLGAGESTKYTFIMMLTTVTMMSISGNLSRLLGNRRKPFIVFGSVNAMCAVGLLLAGTLWRLPPPCFLTGYIMLAMSCGLTPVVVSFLKELSPSDVAAMAIGYQNTLCYIGVALSAYLIGMILDMFKAQAVSINGAWIYPSQAYVTILSVMFCAAVVSVLAILRSRETQGQTIYGTSGPAAS
jgi:predicted MFS family arabinose efflux permease